MPTPCSRGTLASRQRTPGIRRRDVRTDARAGTPPPHDGRYHFLAASAALRAAFSCSAFASRSLRCAGVRPSRSFLSFEVTPLASLRFCARMRSISRWLPRVCKQQGQGGGQGGLSDVRCL
ncbi:hypothetical protein ABPG75_002282 [Micractinium tetrahymenae]